MRIGRDGSDSAARSPAPAVSSPSDVFICYSRRDREFVRRLQAALVRAGKDAYVDWEDIPSWSPDYESELASAIDACDSFLFVVSRDSLVSPHCAFELERAVEHGKRLRPLKRREENDAPVPDALRKPQWVDFSSDDRFEEAFERLLEAISVDADWVRRHTRLGLRAAEWERADSDASLLLRGSDLRDAEAWRDDQVGKEPPPTALQIGYVASSRQASTRRQRATLFAVVCALAVALGLAVLALLQRNRAIAQRNEATSLALAAAAKDQLGARPDVSLLLGLEAVRAKPSNEEARAAAISALEAVRASGIASILRGHSGAVTSIAFSSDRRMLATAGEDGTVRLWDIARHRQVGRPLFDGTDVVFSVAFSPHGQTLAGGGADGAVRLWDVRNREELGGPLTGHEGYVLSVAFSPDGRLLASGGLDGTIRLWDVKSHRQLGAPLGGGFLAADEVAFSPDGGTLASANDDRAIRLWDVRTHAQLGPPLTRYVVNPDDLPDNVESVAFSPDGHTLVSAGDDGVRLWDVRTRRQLGDPFPRLILTVESVAFSPDGRTLVSASTDGVRLWDVRTHRRLGRVIAGEGSVAFSPDGRTLAFGARDGTVRLRRLDAHERPGLPRGGSVGAVAFSPDGRTVATTGGDGTVRLWNARNHEPVGRPLHRHVELLDVHGVAFSRDGATLAIAMEDRNTYPAASVVELWNVPGHRRLFLLRGHSGGALSIAFSPDGHTLAFAGIDENYDGWIRLWDVRSHRELGRPLRISTAGAPALAFSPDGRVLASGGGRVRLWDVRSHRPLGRPVATAGDATSVAFSSDDHTLAYVDEHGAHLVDAHTRQLLGQPFGAPVGVKRVAFSPDGRTLASVSGDAAQLWDVRSHKQLGSPRTEPAPAGVYMDSDRRVTSLAFSPDGRTFVTAGDPGLVFWDGLLWRDAADLRTQVCELIWGNLTQTEWEQVVPGLSYRTSCPS